MKRTFKNFIIEANFELPITHDNFFKHSLTIKNSNDVIIGTIRKEEISYDLANQFATGDEAVVKDAILCVIRNREMWIEELRNVL